MLKGKKQLITKLLILAMCTSLTPTTLAFAEETNNIPQVNVINGNQTTISTENNVYIVNDEANPETDFQFDSVTGSIVGYGGTRTDVLIPKTINGIPVTSIGEGAFQNCNNLTSVIIPDGITSIGGSAFYNCSNLRSITIPTSVINIGESAFSYCESLTEITIPEGVTNIEKYTFKNCTNLTSVTIPSSVKTIGMLAFSECRNLSKVTIPYDVSSIEEGAFTYCSSLSEITIPNSVTKIGNSAFAFCDKLASIVIPDNVSSIGEFAFYYCGSLTDITIQGNVERIGRGTFQGCASLKNITIPNSVTSIGAEAFYKCTSLTSINIPSSVISIEDSAFAACLGLTNVKIPYSVLSIGETAFDMDNDAMFYVESSIIKERLINEGVDGSRIILNGQPVVIVSSVTLDRTRLNLLKGDTIKLTATVLPDNASDKELVWSSNDPEVATVDCNGNVTAVGVGTVDIVCTAKDGSNKSATCNVNVTSPVAVTNVALSYTSLNLLKGETSTLTATVSPTNADNKDVTWISSNPEVATVDSNGSVTAVGVGTVDIICTAKDGSNKSATCNVIVTSPVAVTNVALSCTSLNLLKGETSTLTATVSPTNADNKDVTWTSSNPEVATVDGNGKVTAVGDGTAAITCTAKDGSNKSATCNMIVTSPVAVTNVALSCTSLNLLKGETSTLTATVSPTNADNKDVIWTSSNPEVATVDGNGKVTAVGNGIAAITCTAKDGSNKSASCTVNVTSNVLVTSIKLSNTTLVIGRGRTAMLTATVFPYNASNKEVMWNSSNTRVATVDNNGKVIGISKGYAIITCKAMDGSNVKATATVTVTNK